MGTVPPVFEIRVALIGYVSVGKTTILNALLRDKYSEVSMKRTAAGINLFRIDTGVVSTNGHCTPKSTLEEITSDNNVETGGSEPQASMNMDEGNTRQLSMLPTNGHRTPESTLEEITSDNNVLRHSNVMQEKTFDIKLDEPLFDMRKDTKLTLIDVPGINEAGISKKYKDYVLNNWHSFDCAIIVLDGRQGVNTDEQVELLTMVQIACQTEKKIPLIVLLNKIDEPDDEEQQVLVREATQKINDMFNVPNQSDALRDIMTRKLGTLSTNANVSPLVIAISAVHAFIYRMGSNLSFENFQTKIDKALVDKLGREAHGRRWKKFSPADQMKKAYEVIQDKEQNQEGIEASQFDKFLSALSFCVGGIATQEWLIEEQIKVSNKILVSSLDYVTELKSLHNKRIRLNKTVDFETEKFLELHKASTEKAFECFTDPNKVHHLAKPMEELFSYCKLLKHMGVFGENKQEIIDLAKGLVLRQVETVLNGESWTETHLTHHDWIIILGSMIGVCAGRAFCEHFILVRILLEKKFHEFLICEDIYCFDCSRKLLPGRENILCCEQCRVGYVDKLERNSCAKCNLQNQGRNHSHYSSYHSHSEHLKEDFSCSATGWSHKLKHCNEPLRFRFEGGKFVPSDTELFQKMIHFEVVETPADPKHFGHLIWRFSDLLESVIGQING